MKILVVEDEEALANGLKFNFEQEGYEAVVAGDGPTAIEVRPNGVTPLAPVAVASEPKEPAAEAARDPKPRRKPAQAEAARAGTSAEELRAGLKRMLKRKWVLADELETVQADGTEAPARTE